MRLTTCLSLSAAVVLSGCAVSHQSPWHTARTTRIQTASERLGSEGFAERLSGDLKAAGVQHKVVTYEYNYRTRSNEQAIASRTAVVYRDGSSGRHQWWLMEDRLRTPFWLPGEDLEYQVSFYLRRPATIVSVDGRGVGSEAKGVVAAVERESRFPLARLKSLAKAGRLQAKVSAPKPGRTAAVSEKAKALFRARHGTKFDPASIADRLKMERLLSGAQRTVAFR